MKEYLQVSYCCFLFQVHIWLKHVIEQAPFHNARTKIQALNVIATNFSFAQSLRKECVKVRCYITNGDFSSIKSVDKFLRCM